MLQFNPCCVLQVVLSHLEALKRCRGSGPATAEVSSYDCLDAYYKRVRVYVYAESWGLVEQSKEEVFLKAACQLHDVRPLPLRTPFVTPHWV
jgi:hypothetical protein